VRMRNLNEHDLRQLKRLLKKFERQAKKLERRMAILRQVIYS
jgi:hypothetical protein